MLMFPNMLFCRLRSAGLCQSRNHYELASLIATPKNTRRLFGRITFVGKPPLGQSQNPMASFPP